MFKKNIFSVPVWHVNITGAVKLKEIEQYSLNMSQQTEGRTISNLGGFQSYDLIMNEHPMFNDLYDAIKLQTDLFCDQVNINRVSNIGNIWVNVNEYGHSNQAHHHANCVLSGVFYAHTEYNEQAGSIVFKHPASDLMAYNWANIQKGEYIPENSLNWRFDCKPGDLIIFPSWLIHHVQPNLALNYKRISISFNLS